MVEGLNCQQVDLKGVSGVAVACLCGVVIYSDSKQWSQYLTTSR